jgi:tetratricopeptide (TPR) repeat protein
MEIQPLIHRLVELPYSDVLSGLSQIIEKEGVADAIEWYQQAKEKYADYYIFSESPLNTLGYRLLGQDKTAEAIELFKLAALDYPQSANAYDSLGEAYMKDGQNDLAIKNYKKSLEINPDNNNAREKLKELNKDY